ncbi:MAG: HAD-IC family P-type ATPase, partial [Deltaproteobacteria bacterium]|nr:HAD-IC family P-type ATPase [Deltaproteobacteria bacterium]
MPAQALTGDQVEFPGLTAAEVEESRRLHGTNVLTPPPRVPWWKLYLEKFADPIIRILLAAAVIAILAGLVEGHYAEGIGIVIAVFLATTLGFINEYKAGLEFEVLNQVSDDEPIRVIRDGRHTSAPKRDLVVGDILVLEQGEEIPADAEVLSSVSFQVNEASLTGESVPVAKRPQAAVDEGESGLAYPRHQVLRGTFVSDGHALARVTLVGDNSEIGRTARAAAEETESQTPLNRQLGRLGKVISACGFSVALLIFSVLSVRAVWLGQLGEHAAIERIALSADSGQASETAVAAARAALRLKYGAAADTLPVLSRVVDETKEYYLQLPLTGGQLYFLILASLAAILALTRIWLPVAYDMLEMLGRNRRENSCLKREDFRPWLQSLLAATLVFGLGLGAGLAFGWLAPSPAAWLPISAGMTLLGYFMVAVTIIVVAVPEGLPMSVTLSLAYSMRKMTAANNLVRRLHACETIGAATVICSDKTGTLTLNEMRVSSLEFSNLGEAAMASPGLSENPEWGLLVEAVAANSTAHLGEDSAGRPRLPLGNPTESALLIWLEEHGLDYRKARAAFAMAGQLTFSTERKYMASLGAGVLPNTRILHVKGAPEMLLGRCVSRRLPEGASRPLTDQDRAILLDSLRAEQARGMRTLGFAFCLPDGVSEDQGLSAERIQELVQEDRLTWLGFFSIADPVRPEVPGAIASSLGAGVKVKMVTGDNQATAWEIAGQIGMLDKNDTRPGLMVTGDEFMAMDEKTAAEAAETLKIMSRARPLAKQRLVTLLQKQGEVVAVTGDGSNDAPALNHADVGLAMGVTGTSVAKEAADIILLDDSFASIVKAIMWGRSLYANIQKFILFQLTINVAALGIALLGPFLGVQLPLTVTQML